MRSMSMFFANRNNLLALMVAATALFWIANNNGSRHAHFSAPELDIRQAKAAMDSGALVIDIRGAEQFAARHLPGAVLVPLAVLRTGIPPSIAAAKDKPVVVYCNKGLASGQEATHLLQQAGFSQAANLRSGIEGWAAAGLPVNTR